MKAPVAGDDEAKWEDPRNNPEDFPGNPLPSSFGSLEPSPFKNPPDVVHPSSMNIAAYGGRTTPDLRGVAWREKERGREDKADALAHEAPSPSRREDSGRLRDMLRERREQEADIMGMPEYSGDEKDPDLQGPPSFPPSKYGGERPKGFHDAIRESETERQSKLKKPWRENWENSLEKLMKFVTIQKIGYTTQPEDAPDDPVDWFADKPPSPRQGGELNPQWQDASQSVQQIGRNIGNQSFGIPASGSKEHQKLLDTLSRVYGHPPEMHGENDPVPVAQYYLNSIKNQTQDKGHGLGHNYNEVEMHMVGHQALAEIQNVMQFGEDFLDHPDAIRYLAHERNPNFNREDERKAEREGREYEEPYFSYEPPMSKRYGSKSLGDVKHGEWPDKYETEMTIPLEEYHRQLLHGHLNPNMTNAGKGMADELHRKIRMESPGFNPEAEEAYYLSHWPESLHTSGSSDTPSRYEEEVIAGTGGSAKEGEISRVSQPDVTDPLHPAMRGNAGYAYDTHEQRRREHGERQGTEGTPEIVQPPKPKVDKPGAFERIFPEHYDEKSVSKLMKFIFKEGDSGAADGLSGTVFTSTHSGIFNPTYGGSKVRRIHKKNRRKQDKKRKRLMGKDKKNGVDRLVQFLGHGSPLFHKRQPNKDMTGQMQGGSAAGQNITPLKQINWAKRQEGISKVESHPTMGMNNTTDGKMAEAGMAATYPQEEDLTAMNQMVEKKPDWNSNNYRVHKQDELSIQNASPGGSTGIGPPTNQNTMAATGDHPQAAYTEKFDDDEKKQQVITQNDFENRVKQYDNKENDSGTIDQPRAAGATASMASYPDSSMQMMEKAWGSGPDTFDQDALHRGGDKDVSDDEEDIDENKREDDHWIPEDEDTVKAEKDNLRKFQKLYIETLLKEDTSPMLSALMALDND